MFVQEEYRGTYTVYVQENFFLVEDICTVMYRRKSTKEIACTIYVKELRIFNAEITCTVHVQEELLLSRIHVQQVKRFI